MLMVANARSSLKPWSVCFSVALLFFYEFIQMSAPSAISQNLMHDFGLSATQLGFLSAAFVAANTFFLLPAGLLLDRLSVRKVVTSAVVLCIVGTVGLAMAHSFAFAIATRFLTGVGNAFSLLSCVIIVSRWFPAHRQALLMGLLVTFAFCGGLIAQTPLEMLTQHVGWRHALLIDASFGIVVMLLIWMNVRDYPSDYQHQESTVELSLKQGLVLAMRNKQNWLCGVYGSLLNLPIMLLSALWGGIYLFQMHHLTMTQATMITSMILAGSMIGSPVAGWVSDRIGVRRLPMFVGAIASFVLVMAIMYVPGLSLNALIMLFFALGFFTSSQVICYPLIAESNKPAITGTATSLAAIIIMGGAAVAQPLFGWLMDHYGAHVTVNGYTNYSAQSFHWAMAIFPIAFVVGLLALIFIRETNCKSES